MSTPDLPGVVLGPHRTCGGLGTTLMDAGLPPGTPADAWVLSHPDRVREAHASFVRAGARIVCTATLSAPQGSLDSFGVSVAVELARDAAAGRAEVWLSLGPGADHAALVDSVATAVDGVVLETFVDQALAEEVAATIRWSGPKVVSIVVGPRGRTLAGPSLRRLDPSLRQRGWHLGLNCASAVDLLRAAHAIPDDRLWLKPNGPVTPVEARALRERAYWLGLCCGGSAKDLERLNR